MWIEQCEESFKELKKHLVTAPVLTLPDDHICFAVYTNTSLQGLSCMLMQSGKVIGYGSQQLQPHELNYSAHDLELAAVIHTLKCGDITYIEKSLRSSLTLKSL